MLGNWRVEVVGCWIASSSLSGPSSASSLESLSSSCVISTSRPSLTVPLGDWSCWYWFHDSWTWLRLSCGRFSREAARTSKQYRQCAVDAIMRRTMQGEMEIIGR